MSKRVKTKDYEDGFVEGLAMAAALLMEPKFIWDEDHKSEDLPWRPFADARPWAERIAERMGFCEELGDLVYETEEKVIG